MKTMKLYLYQSTPFLCINQENILYTPDKGLKQLRTDAEQHNITLIDDEIAIFTTRDKIFEGSQNSIAIGAGPFTEELPNEHYQLRSIPEGTFFFYQFADSSPEGITSALQYSIQSMKTKNMKSASDEVILRGVKEVGFYVYQIIIPVL